MAGAGYYTNGTGSAGGGTNGITAANHNWGAGAVGGSQTAGGTGGALMPGYSDQGGLLGQGGKGHGNSVGGGGGRRRILRWSRRIYFSWSRWFWIYRFTS